MKNGKILNLHFFVLELVGVLCIVMFLLAMSFGQDSNLMKVEELRRQLAGQSPVPKPSSGTPTKGLTRGIAAAGRPINKRLGVTGIDNIRSLVTVEVPDGISMDFFGGIRFGFDSLEYLDEASRRVVVEVAMVMKELAKDGRKFLIEGHACPLGNYDYNLRLSYGRAEKVRQDLINMGVPESAVQAIGCGQVEVTRDLLGEATEVSVLQACRRVSIHALTE